MNFFLDAKQIGFWFDSARRVFAKRGAYTGAATHQAHLQTCAQQPQRDAGKKSAPRATLAGSRGEPPRRGARK